MDYLLLLCTAFTGASLSLFSSYFDKKNADKKDTTQFYNLIMIAAVFIGWGAYWIFEGGFDPKVLVYSLLFGIGYAGAVIGLVNAIKTGSVSISTLFLQFSLIGTTVWGFFFWGDDPSVLTWVGIALVVFALIFCLYRKREPGEQGISFKWLMWCAICFAGNGLAAIMGKTQQLAFGGELKGQFMTVATGFSFIITVILYLISNKRDTKRMLKTSYLPAIAGFINVGHNLIVLILATSKAVPPSLVYPFISVGGIMIVSLFSFIALKEKITPLQWVGITLGAVATVLLSI